MKYLIDSNVFIEARDRYYSFEMVPGFWRWVEERHREGMFFSVTKVKDELIHRKDDLAEWVRALPEGFFLEPDSKTFESMALLSDWTDNHPTYNDLAVQEFLGSADYILAAHAHAHKFEVVSQEVAAPRSKTRVKLPDACDCLGVECRQTFDWLKRCEARF